MQSLQGPRKPAVGCQAGRHARLEARVVLPVPVACHAPLQAACAQMKLTERRGITRKNGGVIEELCRLINGRFGVKRVVPTSAIGTF
jgi:hypothetical protein